MIFVLIKIESRVAPVLRIGTLILMGPPLGFLPWHRNDRFPRSPRKPRSCSRHLYACRRSDSKQAPPNLSWDRKRSQFWRHLKFSTPHQWFIVIRLHDPYLARSCRAFSLTLTTMALYHSSLRWFEACSCKPTPRDLPSSFVQPRGALFPTDVDFQNFSNDPL